MKTLDQITQELVVVNSELELTDGELDLELEKELALLDKELATKVDHYVHRIEKLDLNAEFWVQKAREARAVANSIYAHIDNMKARIKNSMITLDKKVLTGEKYKFSIRPTPKLKVNILDETKVPAQFKVLEQKWVISKDLIREELEQGRTVDGCELEQSMTLNTGINR